MFRVHTGTCGIGMDTGKDNDLQETTRVELTDISVDLDARTLTDREIDESGSEDFQIQGLGRAQLVEQYRAVLRARAIYYPVAFQFLAELGRGRQGVVFLGIRQGARGCLTRHAIKVYDPGIYPSARKYWTDMGRIASQISQMQSLRSPYLVSRESYDEVNGIGYVQMEAIDGMDGSHLLKGLHLDRVRHASTPEEWARFTDVIFKQMDGRTAIQPGVAIHILRGILRGLESLHQSGFMHCDVKPSNVMLDRNGFIKVIDYGRAVMVDEKVSFLVGTPSYMAPEVHRRQTSRRTSDIYSVGLIAIELLSGQRPVPRELRSEKELYAYKLTLLDRLPALVPEYVRENEELMRMLCMFLHPDPDKRYQDSTDAEAGTNGLAQVHRQLVRSGIDADYDRELRDYLAKLVDPRINRVVI